MGRIRRRDRELATEFGSRTVAGPDKGTKSLENKILFRGQADSCWKLKTTLERATTSPYTVQNYLQRADSCVNQIESVTGHEWHVKPYPDILKEIEETQDFMRVCLPHYDYLVYLRHHGFPSPLLDWTTSPYIAAHFAFEERNTADPPPFSRLLRHQTAARLAGAATL